MSSHICIVGSLNIDFMVSTPRCPGPGETITARCFSVSPGGKGANQAVACGRALFISSPSLKSQQDVTVTMIGAVGSVDGYYRNLIRPMLEKSGVDTTDIDERRESQTGSATIIVEDASCGENRILVVPGANHEGMTDAQKIITTIRDRHQQRQLDVPTVVVLQGEIPRETVLQLLEYFNNQKDCSTHVVFNPAPVFPEGVPLSALARTSVLVMNETEAAQMGTSVLGDKSSAKNFSSEKDEFRLEELAKRFHDVARVQIVLITLGARGVYFSTCTGRKGLVKGVTVRNVVDSTAAGDTLVGYFAVAFARFLETSSAKLEDFDTIIERVVRDANSASAVCVQRQGAMHSIPFAYEIGFE